LAEAPTGLSENFADTVDGPVGIEATASPSHCLALHLASTTLVSTGFFSKWVPSSSTNERRRFNTRASSLLGAMA
jgi:hypothetical protein